MNQGSDTIHAMASAAGRAGVAVMRVSGANAPLVLKALTHKELPAPRRLVLRALFRATDVALTDLLDEAMVVHMPGPNSFTGEDCAELHLHGGSAIIQSVLKAISETGFSRLAEPGEFTRRAFENGKIDLTQAEAIADLIDAETEAQRRQAFGQFGGDAQKRIDRWREMLIEAMASLEAEIDFPDEEDVPDIVGGRAFNVVGELKQEIEQALLNADRGMAVREGFRVAILGAPNAGKSSLLNAIAGREAAIVSDIPGTTRDAIEVRLVLNGYVVWVVDTAGLREAADVIEAEGVRRAIRHAEEADLRILVSSSEADDASLTILQPGDLLVVNKVDIKQARDDLLETARGMQIETVQTSVLQSRGLNELMERLSDIVSNRLESQISPVVTRDRHRRLLQDAHEHLLHGEAAMKQGVGVELASEDLRLAARALGAVTGAVDVEDLLDRIFSEFCIGK